jgi:hypothetical protein
VISVAEKEKHSALARRPATSQYPDPETVSDHLDITISGIGDVYYMGLPR